MPPSQTTNNQTHGALADAIACCDAVLSVAGGVQHSDLADLFVGKTGIPDALTSCQSFGVGADSCMRRGHESGDVPCGVGVTSPQRLRLRPGTGAVSSRSAPLAPHVAAVVGPRAENKMSEAWTSNAVDDVDTRLVVADTGAHIADVQDGHAGRNRAKLLLEGPGVRAYRAPTQRPERTVAASCAGCPKPARLGTVNPIPEALVIGTAQVYSAWHQGNLLVSAPRGVTSTAGASYWARPVGFEPTGADVSGIRPHAVALVGVNLRPDSVTSRAHSNFTMPDQEVTGRRTTLY
jgi:hypothetical protein